VKKSPAISGREIVENGRRKGRWEKKAGKIEIPEKTSRWGDQETSLQDERVSIFGSLN